VGVLDEPLDWASKKFCQDNAEHTAGQDLIRIVEPEVNAT
jgi:hypothetical protein